ncbi:hypothetical protein PR202_gb15592 [Eleusine coracana subsp. coracana]|uniref:Uncharacterized protein n=1 Tax=Eleusine coracana subsp. coracana TaxID=191504 RepID=A0AAV5EYR9_ELECO|nr:hypothetical protein PR202_gb15592 [Eleusine coracana subsp. coracana]
MCLPDERAFAAVARRPVPVIDIDEGEFVSASTRTTTTATGTPDALPSHRRGTAYGKSRCALQDEWSRFTDFADHVTLSTHASPPLDAFRLRVTSLLDTAHRWVRRGLARRPAAFTLLCDCDGGGVADSRSLPEFSFAHYHRDAAALTCRLTTLRLSGLALGRDFGEVIAHDLPVLEDLRLEDCHFWFARIGSRSLKNLAIHNCCCYPSYHEVNVLVLAAPGIVSLRVHGGGDPPTAVTSEDEMPSLVAASLAHPAGELGLLRSLRHARTLNLSRFSTTAFLLEDHHFPVFRNLRALLLEECDVGVECQVLRRFLRNAPRLETLALRYCRFGGGSKRSRKRKSRSSSKMTSSDGHRGPTTAYECKELKSVELEFYQDQDVLQLDDALGDISREAVLPVQSSITYGKHKVKIMYK